MAGLDLLSLANKAGRIGVTEGQSVSLIIKACRYFHYCCDGFDDRVSSIFISCVSMVITSSTCYIVYVGIYVINKMLHALLILLSCYPAVV